MLADPNQLPPFPGEGLGEPDPQSLAFGGLTHRRPPTPGKSHPHLHPTYAHIMNHLALGAHSSLSFFTHSEWCKMCHYFIADRVRGHGDNGDFGVMNAPGSDYAGALSKFPWMAAYVCGWLKKKGFTITAFSACVAGMLARFVKCKPCYYIQYRWTHYPRSLLLGPKLFVKPSSKSNRHIIANAISHCCLAGTVNTDVKNKVLDVSDHFGTYAAVWFFIHTLSIQNVQEQCVVSQCTVICTNFPWYSQM